MKRIREALRLRERCALSLRKTAQALSVSRPVLSDYLTRCEEKGINYEKSLQMTDEQLSDIFHSEVKKENTQYQKLLSNFPEYSKQLLRPGVTRQLLWEEYCREHNGTYSYSQFCYHFQQWSKTQQLSMVIEHKAGDKLFVDFTGKKLHLVNRHTGEFTPVEVFVAALGASKLIYAEAVRSQKKQDFIQAQVNTLEYIGGVPKAIVPDCLKSAVTKGHRYEPDINPEYQDFAQHYEMTILAARPYKPKDKALVEGAVRIVYQRIFAPLRDKEFLTLEQLNEAIRGELEKLNNRIMRQYEKSRREMFNEIEREYLCALPLDPYRFREYRKLKVQFNYHVYLNSDKHYYSVPHRYRDKHVELFITPKTVEIFHNNERIALHPRDYLHYGYSTMKQHMPPQHCYKNNWNAEKLLSWAASIGTHVRDVIEIILDRKAHPEQGFKSCMGILSLSRKYTGIRLDSACRKALKYDHVSCKGIENILKNGVEECFEPELYNVSAIRQHENIRGKQYYAQEQMQ